MCVLECRVRGRVGIRGGSVRGRLRVRVRVRVRTQPEFLSCSQETGALENTYFVFSSDHGYRFGQMRMPQGPSPNPSHDPNSVVNIYNTSPSTNPDPNRYRFG